MNYEQKASEIIDAIGGTKNVLKLTHCITRLRFNLKNESLADDNKVKNIQGVMGLMKKNGQYQVIVGNDVDKVFNIIDKQLDHKYEKASNKKVGFFSRVIDSVSAILSPLIPPLAAAGMTKVLLLILSLMGIMDKTMQTYIVLDFAADSVFYFMPLLVAYSASRKFQCNPIMAIALAGVLIHPTFTKMVAANKPLSFIGIPISLVNYNATVLPTLMMVWFMSYVERFAEKISPNVIKVFFKPLLVLLIVVPVTMIAIGPAGNYIGKILATEITIIQSKAGWASVAILSSVYSLLVMVGMHRALTPIGLSMFTSLGYEPLLKAAALCSNFSQASACVAVALKTKNKELKQIAGSAATTAFVSGITEPAMYGVTLKLKKPLIACIISSGIAGVYAGFTAVKAYAYATPGIFSFAMFMGPQTSNIMNAVITAVIAIVGAFVLTWILGFDDPIEENETFVFDDRSLKNKHEIPQMSMNQIISSPVSGRIVNLKDVDDDTFASEVCGKGIAIFPDDNTFYSPIDGQLETIFKTRHAFMLRGDNGAEVLVHIGINTVNLEGQYFEALVKEHTHIKKGEPIIKIDKDAITKAGYDLTTCIILTNCDKFLQIQYCESQYVKTNDTLLTLKGDM